MRVRDPYSIRKEAGNLQIIFVIDGPEDEMEKIRLMSPCLFPPDFGSDFERRWT